MSNYTKNCRGVAGGVRKLYVNFDTRFSNDIVGSGNRADYNFVLPVRLTNIKSMSVTNVEMPITYYNISQAFGNNTFRITNVVTGNARTVSLSDGQYTSSGLQTAINAELPVGVTFSINSHGQSVFTNASIGGNGYYLEFYTDTLGGYDKNNPKFKLGWILGFRYIAYPLNWGQSLISECILNLHGPRYLYLLVDEFQNGKDNTFNSALGEAGILKKNILARVAPDYVNFPYSSILPANLANGNLLSDTRAYHRGKVDIQRLNVQVVNEIGQIMALNGGYIMFCLEFEVSDD